MHPIIQFHAFKDLLSSELGMSHAMLHVHAGMAIYVTAQLVLGTRRASGPALAVVAACELANEAGDWIFHGGFMVADTLGDVVATMAWPTILYATGKFRRWHWRHNEAQRFRAIVSKSEAARVVVGQLAEQRRRRSRDATAGATAAA